MILNNKRGLQLGGQALQGLGQQGKFLQAQGRQAGLEADQRSKHAEMENNYLKAQRFALDQSHLMQQDPNMPRTVTDTSMTIGPGGVGTQKMLPPNLMGRFKNLINNATYKAPTDLNMSTPDKVAMKEADFSPIDATAYQDAQYARLKEKAGLMGKSAVGSLSSELAGRGIGNASGAFGKGLANIVSQSVQPLSDLNVSHLEEEYKAAQRARELSESRVQNEYSGNITQRGQDLNQQNALNALKMALADNRYQSDFNKSNQWQQLLLRYLS